MSLVTEACCTGLPLRTLPGIFPRTRPGSSSAKDDSLYSAHCPWHPVRSRVMMGGVTGAGAGAGCGRPWCAAWPVAFCGAKAAIRTQAPANMPPVATLRSARESHVQSFLALSPDFRGSNSSHHLACSRRGAWGGNNGWGRIVRGGRPEAGDRRRGGSPGRGGAIAPGPGALAGQRCAAGAVRVRRVPAAAARSRRAARGQWAIPARARITSARCS